MSDNDDGSAYYDFKGNLISGKAFDRHTHYKSHKYPWLRNFNNLAKYQHMKMKKLISKGKLPNTSYMDYMPDYDRFESFHYGAKDNSRRNKYIARSARKLGRTFEQQKQKLDQLARATAQHEFDVFHKWSSQRKGMTYDLSKELEYGKFWKNKMEARKRRAQRIRRARIAEAVAAQEKLDWWKNNVNTEEYKRRTAIR